MNLKDSARDALHTNFDRLARQREVDARQSKVSGLPIQHADKGELFLAVDGIDKWTEVPLSTDLVNYAQPVTS